MGDCARTEVSRIILQGLTVDIVSKLILAATAPTIDRVSALEEENRFAVKLMHSPTPFADISNMWVCHICSPNLFHCVKLQNAISSSLQAD